MKVKVVNVVDTSFDGKDGTKVAACRLVYELDGKQKALDTYIPPVVTAALAWKPDQEVEIEEYQDKNGKTRFKTPQVGKPGFKGLSYEERVKLDEAQSEAMDRRTALMQAVEWAKGATEGDVLGVAGKFLEWLRNARTPTAQSPPRAVGQDVEAPLTGSKAGDGQSLPETRGRPVPAESAPAASTSTSAGEDKNQGTAPPKTSDAGAEGEGEAPKAPASGLLEQAREAYGKGRSQTVQDARLIAAAAMLWEPVKDATELADDQLRELIDKRKVMAS